VICLGGKGGLYCEPQKKNGGVYIQEGKGTQKNTLWCGDDVIIKGFFEKQLNHQGRVSPSLSGGGRSRVRGGGGGKKKTAQWGRPRSINLNP